MKSIVICLLVALVVAQECKFSKNGASYDPYRLSLEEEDYTVKGQSYDGKSVTFTFNVCKNVNTVPKDYVGGNTCEETAREWNAAGAIKTKDPSPAFISPNVELRNSQTCKRIAGRFNADNFAEPVLYDANFPDAGFTLQYVGGDYCCPEKACDGSQHVQTKFTTHFLCSKTIPASFPDTNFISVRDGCDLRVTFKTGQACPTECPIRGGYVCGQHGTCGYDPMSKKARCYCDKNYSGTDCSKYTNERLVNINTWIVVLTIILVLVLISTILYVYLRLRKIRVNPDAFENLEKKFNELGQMTY